MTSPTQGTTTSIGLLILRLGIGGYMATHGWSKLQMLLGGQFDLIGDPIGLGGRPSLVLITFAELFCAILVAIGLGTRLFAVPIVFGMAVAAFVVQGNDPWTLEAAYELFVAGERELLLSKEPALLYLIPFLALVFTGAGRFSIDALIRSRRQGRGLGPSSLG